MQRNFCDKCGKEIFRNSISGKFNRVCFIKDSFQADKLYKEDELVTFDLCDYCYNRYFDSLNKIDSEGEFVTRMIDSVKSNYLYPKYTSVYDIWKNG